MFFRLVACPVLARQCRMHLWLGCLLSSGELARLPARAEGAPPGAQAPLMDYVDELPPSLW